MQMLPYDVLYIIAKHCDTPTFLNLQDATCTKFKPNKLCKSRLGLTIPEVDVVATTHSHTFYDDRKKPYVFNSTTFKLTVKSNAIPGTRKSWIIHEKTVVMSTYEPYVNVIYIFEKPRPGTRQYSQTQRRYYAR